LAGSTNPNPFVVKVGSGTVDGSLQGATIAKRKDGLVCARKAEKLIVKMPGKGSITLEMADLARTAIERDVLNGPWDGGWDRSLMVDTTVRFDDGGRAYTLIIPRASNLKAAVLLWSTDGCRSWHGFGLVGRNATMEKTDTFNDHASPPTIVSFERYGGNNGSRLWLDALTFKGIELHRAWDRPVLIADNSLLVANHSGGGNSTFTTPGRIVVAYPTTDGTAEGTASVTREIDRRTGQWAGGPKLLGRSTSSTGGPDNHDLAALSMLPSGHLLAVIGAHHSRFKVYESLRPGTALGGWGTPTVLGNNVQNQFSYVSLNVSRAGVINIIARSEWRDGFYELVQFRRNSNRQWQVWPGGALARPIAIPNRHAYVAWRQRLTMGPDGELYLDFAYYANRLTDAEANQLQLPYRDRAACATGRCWYNNAPTSEGITLVSTDDGASWN
jgi:hypothetical protein